MQKDGSKFRKQLRETEHQKIVDLLTARKGEWKGTKINPFRSIAKGELIEEAKVWFYFVSSILRPSKHLSTVGREEAILLYALLKGYKIDVGKMIENSILSYFESKCKGMIPHPATITSLYIQGGVKKEWGIEETYPRASPLTLTKGRAEKKKHKQEKGMKGALRYNNGRAMLLCNQKFREIKLQSGIHSQSRDKTIINKLNVPGRIAAMEN